jgi:hypothetical protein
MFDRTKAEKKKKKSEQVIVNGKTWDKESIRDLLDRNDKAVYRAILLIYSFQTDEEKYTGVTKTVNGKGFNKMDVEILSSYAMQLKQGRELTLKQMYVARPKIKKYAGQIISYMKQREEEKETTS